MATTTKSKGKLSTEERKDLDTGEFAFPKERKEPLHDAAHVRDAIARFDQVQGVTEVEKKAAFKRIKAAAKKFGVEMTAASEGKPAKKSAAKKPSKRAAKKG